MDLEGGFQQYYEVLSEAAAMRFGTLCRARRLDGVETGGAAWLQQIEGRHFAHQGDINRFQQAVARAMNGPCRTSDRCLSLLGAGFDEETRVGWLAWRSTPGPSLRDVATFVANQFPGQRESYREWLLPILDELATAIDELAGNGVGSADLAFSPEHIAITRPDQQAAWSVWQNDLPAAWGALGVRLLPICLDLAVPSVIGNDDRHHRLRWLTAPLPVRFAGLAYGLFGGKCYPEGCPPATKTAPALLLGAIANRKLRDLFSIHDTTAAPPTTRAVFDILAARDVKRAPGAGATTVALRPPPAFVPAPQAARSALPLDPEATVAAPFPAAPATPPAATTIPGAIPQPTTNRWLAYAAVALVLAVGSAVYHFGSRRERPPPTALSSPPPPPTAAATPSPSTLPAAPQPPTFTARPPTPSVAPAPSAIAARPSPSPTHTPLPPTVANRPPPPIKQATPVPAVVAVNERPQPATPKPTKAPPPPTPAPPADPATEVSRRLAGKDLKSIPTDEMDRNVAQLRSAAAKGSTKAMLKLAELYADRTARFTEKTNSPSIKSEVRSLTQQAADLGDPDGIFGVGSLDYQEGNYGRARDYFARAEALGKANARFLRERVEQELKAKPQPAP